MRKRTKVALCSVAALVLAAFVLLLFVPLAEYRDFYCFHCGQTSGRRKVCGLPVSSYLKEGELYDDDISIPAHEHKLIEMCGGRLWMLRGMENWDEFGWTGAGFRVHLRRALQAMPERRAEIIQDYLDAVPRDEDAWARFASKYGTATPAQPAD